MKIASVTTMIVSLAAIMLFSSDAGAQGGHNAAQLERAGWDCMVAGPHNWVHCFNVNSNALVMVVKVFSTDGSQFLGTELLLHEDIYNFQPCPQDGGGLWEFLGADFPYFACHHFETPPAA